MQCCLFYCIMENEQRGMITFILAVCGNVDYVYTFPLSPPSRAAWIEIKCAVKRVSCRLRRRLHGRRGLKSLNFIKKPKSHQSPPSRAAWIEIGLSAALRLLTAGRRLHGRRGLKYKGCTRGQFRSSRRLHGRRGLKFGTLDASSAEVLSPPSRAAWIEISTSAM